MAHLPQRHETTPFLGREREVTEITRLLQKSTCRLVTLTGPGGIGKTRLVTEVARKLAQTYHDGVYFVDLQPVSTVDDLVPALAGSVAPQLRGQSNTQAALFHLLKNKHMLLVLDNFEHLLAGVDVVSALLASTAQVDLLVTSRRVLNLREEWLYAVEGLAVPPSLDVGNPEKYSSVQLFMTYAERIQHSFDLERDSAHAVRICQLVGGMPLAIEIAASWLAVLPCAAIPDEIQRNLDFLTTHLHDVPERHRSIQAVFSQTWDMLSEDERRVLAALSVFRGSFTLEAAEQIAGASLPIMASLIQKSLLDRQENGRYRLHELLRQYADDRLAEDEDRAKQVQEQHCAYYTAFLSERADTITGSQQVTVLHEIADEIEDVRNAWRHIVTQGWIEQNQRAFYTLIEFLDLQGRYLEALRVLDTVSAHLRQAPSSLERDTFLAMSLAMTGGDYVRVGRYDDGREVFQEGLALLQARDVAPPKGFGSDPLSGLALLEMILGNHPEAVTLAEQTRARCEADNDLLNAQVAYYVLANANSSQGKHAIAQEHVNRAYEYTRQTGNRWMMANVLILMGDIECALKQYDPAREYYESACAIKREMNDPEGMAFAYQRLGRVAYLQQRYDQAEQLNKQSLALYREIFDPGGLAKTLNNLGDTIWCQGDSRQAVRYYHDALQIALDIQWIPLVLLILTSTQNVIRHTDPQRAIDVLAYIQRTASERETRAIANDLLAEMGGKPQPAQDASAQQQAAAGDVLQIGREVLAKLALLRDSPEPIAVPSGTSTQQAANDALIDPLTERELEVLGLMAQGMTNQQIAEELFVVLGTVKAHSHSIYSKLGVGNRVRAVKRAEELKLL